jgi:outer membrane protein OmpA-like peptidoglycan-associated protein
MGGLGAQMDTTTTPTDDRTSGTIVVETRTVRRPVGKVYWIGVVIVVLLLTMGVGVSRGPSIEQALKKDVLTALNEAGYKGVSVSIDGRMVTANVPTGVEADDVKKVVSEVDGVSAVSAMLVYASYGEARDCADLQKKLDQATRKQKIPFQGVTAQLTAEGTRMLRSVAKLLKDCKTAVVHVGGHTDPGTRFGSTLSLDRAKAMVKVLKSLGVAKDRLEPRGYGDQFPIDKSRSAAARAKNERGSIVVRSQ